MSGPALRGRLRPTQQQRLLLRCAFGDDEEVATTWGRLRPTLEFDRLDEGSHALIPLVYRSLTRARVDDPLLPRMKGVYRKTWYANQLLFGAGATALTALSDAGVEALVVNGGALVATQYGESGLRRVPHLEVVVREADTTKACRTLGAVGWVTSPDPDTVPAARPVPFYDRRGNVLLMRRRFPVELLVPGSPDGRADELWSDVRVTTVGGAPAMVLTPTNQFLWACAAGPDATLLPNVQWLVDAATIAAAAHGDLDWGRLARLAAARKVALRVSAALSYLDEAVGLSLPAEAQLAVLRDHVSQRERLSCWLYAASQGKLGGFPRTLGRHIRENLDESLIRTLTSLPVFLQQAWEVERPSAVVVMALRKAHRTLLRGPVRELSRS